MEQINILVVDDEKEIADLVEIYLVSDGYKVFKANNAKEGLEILDQEEIHLVLLDIMMPGMDGFAVCKQVRRYKKIPVIMLSARGEEYDRIKGFELGVDDYVVKPFSPKELMCRVRVVAQRNSVSGTAYTKSALQSSVQAGQSEKSQEIEDTLTDRKVYCHGDLVVDFTGRSVMIKDHRLDLTPKEYDLLFYLVENRNIALSRDKLITNVWGYDYYGDDRTLDTHIKRLRSSLEEYRSCIVTLRGVGYRFDDHI